MYFDSLAAVMYMEGHGIYVWSAYAITFVLLSWLLWAPAHRLREHKRWIIAEAQRRAASDEFEFESVPQSDRVLAAERDAMESSS
jgi:heme exporter protein D